MSRCSYRIQGGVYIWACALLSIVSALIEIGRAVKGFCSFFSISVLAIGIAYVVNCIVKRSIVKRVGSIEGELGPIIGIVCVGTSEFVFDFSTRVKYEIEDVSYFMIFIYGAFSAVLVSYAVLFIGRRLNHYEVRLGKDDCRLMWRVMGKSAQNLCLIAVVFVAVLLIVFMTFNDLCVNMSGFLMNLFLIAGLLLSLISLFRGRLFDVLISKLFGDSLGGRIPNNTCSIWQDSFTLHDYFAAFVGSGVAGLVFVFCPQFQHFSWLYMSVVLFGVFAGFFSLCLIWWLDRMYFIEILLLQWRMETVDSLKSREEERVSCYNTALKDRIIEFITVHDNTEWKDLSVISGLAERFRREWNERFCPYGKYKYISEWKILNREEIMARYIENYFDTINQSAHLLNKWSKAYEAMDDRELIAELSKETTQNIRIDEPSDEVVKKCVDDFSLHVDRLGIKPVCYMNLDIRINGREGKFRIEIKEDGESVLIKSNDQEGNVLLEFMYDGFDGIKECDLAALVNDLI